MNELMELSIINSKNIYSMRFTNDYKKFIIVSGFEKDGVTNIGVTTIIFEDNSAKSSLLYKSYKKSKKNPVVAISPDGSKIAIANYEYTNEDNSNSFSKALVIFNYENSQYSYNHSYKDLECNEVVKDPFTIYIEFSPDSTHFLWTTRYKEVVDGLNEYTFLTAFY